MSKNDCVKDVHRRVVANDCMKKRHSVELIALLDVLRYHLEELLLGNYLFKFIPFLAMDQVKDNCHAVDKIIDRYVHGFGCCLRFALDDVRKMGQGLTSSSY